MGSLRRRLAAIAAVAAAALTVAVVLLSSGPGSYRVTAVFDQVNGLVTGADVEVAGTRIGRVEDIALGADGLPHVGMTIDGDYRLREGATADLRAFSVAGEVNRFVSVQRGTGAPLRDGATLGLAHTGQPVEIEQVLSTLDPRTRADVRAVLAGLDASTAGRRADIARTLAHSADALGNTADVLAQVTDDGRALRTLVRQGSAIMQTLAADPSGLGATADRLAALLRTTARREAKLARAASLLGPGLAAPRAALGRLDAALGTLDGLVVDARPGVRRLVPFARALRPTLRAAKPALKQLAALVRHSPRDLRRLRPLLERATPTIRTLSPLLSAANPILDETRVRLPDFFSFFSNWADFTANYDANGHGARVGIVIPPAPLNTIDGNSTAAGHLPAPFVRSPGVLGGEPWTTYRDSFVGGKGAR